MIDALLKVGGVAAFVLVAATGYTLAQKMDQRNIDSLLTYGFIAMTVIGIAFVAGLFWLAHNRRQQRESDDYNARRRLPATPYAGQISAGFPPRLTAVPDDDQGSFVIRGQHHDQPPVETNWS